MTNLLPGSSNKFPAEIVEVLQKVKEVADGFNIPLLLVGATARNIIFNHIYGLKAFRATRDIDFAVMLNSWEAMLTKSIAENGEFTLDSKIRHRFYATSGSKIIDIFPFGRIESPKGIIQWESGISMNMVGFSEAFENSLEIEMAEDFVFRVVSPLGFSLLKLIAWSDRKSNKDSQDFWFVLKNWIGLPNNLERYFEFASAENDFESVPAGAMLLGKDIADLISANAIITIAEIFEDQKALDKFAWELYRGEGNLLDNFEANFDKIVFSLKTFYATLTQNL